MPTLLPTPILISENELYENIIKKIDKIKNNIIKLKEYSNNSQSDTNKNIKFLEKFNYFSTELNNMKALVDDMYDEFIIESNPNELSNEDKQKRNNLIIEKKIQNTFLPYMLYLQILLNNSSE
jgi:hypothetical protein